MKRLMMIVGLLALLPACAGHQVRLSGGGAITDLHGKLELDEGETVKETADGGTTYRGRAELNRPAGQFERTTAGIYADVGLSEGFDTSESVDSQHVAGGVIFRHHFTDGELRPFVEGRVGYRHTWLDVGGERGNGPGLDAGGGVGLEFGPAFLLFEYSTGIYEIDDFSGRTDEFGVMLGGKLDF